MPRTLALKYTAPHLRLYRHVDICWCCLLLISHNVYVFVYRNYIVVCKMQVNRSSGVHILKYIRQGYRFYYYYITGICVRWIGVCLCVFLRVGECIYDVHVQCMEMSVNISITAVCVCKMQSHQTAYMWKHIDCSCSNNRIRICARYFDHDIVDDQVIIDNNATSTN